MHFTIHKLVQVISVEHCFHIPLQVRLALSCRFAPHRDQIRLAKMLLSRPARLQSGLALELSQAQFLS